MNKIIIAILGVVALVATMLGIATAATATGGQSNNEPTCDDQFITKIVHHEAVTHTEYHFRKFVRTKYKSDDIKGFWQNFEPNDHRRPFTGPPSWPVDPRGTWSAKKYSGGPNQSAQGVFQSGQGNGSWFYRQQSVVGTWGDYGPWEPWNPEQHTSWELSDAPLGEPQSHGQGLNWYRQWQARFDGQTRTVTDEEAWDEEIQVPNPDYPCPTEEPTPTEPPSEEPTPTQPPVTETPTPTVPPTTETPVPPVTETPVPTPPTETPDPPSVGEPPAFEEVPPTREARCVGDAWVTTTTDAMGNSEQRSIQGAARCAPDEGAPPVKQEGM